MIPTSEESEKPCQNRFLHRKKRKKWGRIDAEHRKERKCFEFCSFAADFYESRHGVVACAHEHADPAKRRDDEETHAEPEPKRLAAPAGDHPACVGLDDVGENYKDNNQGF